MVKVRWKTLCNYLLRCCVLKHDIQSIQGWEETKESYIKKMIKDVILLHGHTHTTS